MKKIAVAALALVAAGAAMAEVTSANIVGYTTATLSQQWTILGVNFTAVDGSNLTIQDALPYVAGMTKGAAAAAADQIQIQKAGGGYDTYYMSNGKNAKGSTVAGLEGKWAKAGAYAATTDTTAFTICSAIWDMAEGTMVLSPWKNPRSTPTIATIKSTGYWLLGR